VAVSVIVFCGGYLTMFTGLGKPASEMCLVVVSMATFAIRALRGQASLIPFSIVAAVGFALHRSSIVLVPTWFYVVWSYARGRPNEAIWRRPSNLAAIIIPAATATLMFPRIARIAEAYDLSHHVLTPEAQGRGLLVTALDPHHLAALVNLLVAMS